MASEASWQTSAGGGRDTFSADQPMDQRTVESLLRRLVDRVEESERRYGEALDELHARLDQLTQTAEAARDTGPAEDTETFDRLHNEMGALARRFERESAAPLDDFERLGKALQDNTGLGAASGDLPAAKPFEPEPSLFAKAAMAAAEPAAQPMGTPAGSAPDFMFRASEAPGSFDEEKTVDKDEGDLDQRLVDMAQRLERSIGTVMPTAAIEALNGRLDDIASQLSETAEKAPTRESLQQVERQLSEMGQQLVRAEEQLGKVGGIEGQLLQLIERIEEKAPQPQGQIEPALLEEIASKAATEAARIVANEAKPATERLDAMQRELSAMSEKSRERGDRLVTTLEAVHESLKQLVQQMERGGPSLEAKPRSPFVERVRQAQAAAPQMPPRQRPAAPQAEKTSAPAGAPAKTGADRTAEEAAPSEPAPAAPSRFADLRIEKAPEPVNAGLGAQGFPKDRTLRERLGAAIPDFKEQEEMPPFGRAKRAAPDEQAVDLDAETPPKRVRAGTKFDFEPDALEPSESAPRRSRTAAGLNAKTDDPDDLVAAARRAAQAAALRAEERGRGTRVRRVSDPLAGSAPIQEGRRRRSLLIVAAAVLLVLSAALLYGRLRSKPDTEIVPPAAEETMPAPADTTSPDGTAPAQDPEKSGSWAPLPGVGTPSDSAESQERETTGFTDVAKSSHRGPAASSGLTAEPQLASLTPIDQAELPPGVIFSIEDPSLAAEGGAQGTPAAPSTALAAPAKHPMPPAALGPLPLRQAAANGDAKAQYVIAVRYADGKGTARNLEQAAVWLERAAGAGLAPAQYRLAAMYERGIGVGKDLGKAQSWYEAAAEKGNIKAMHNLAVGVSGRNGGESDYALAAKWYAEAAAYGLADSQFNLGILAEHGLGIQRNLADAYKWFSLAAAKGDEEAAKRREIVRVQLDPATVAQVEAAIKAWQPEQAVAEANEVVEPAAWALASAKAPAPNSTLVIRAQTLLNQLGYDAGPTDGLMGDRTRTAIKQFERSNGLKETGEVSIPLVTKLESLTS